MGAGLTCSEVDERRAEEALSLIRRVVEQTRDDLVEQNWGLLWMIHAVVNFVGFASVGLVMVPRGGSVVWQLGPLAAAGFVDGVLVLLLARRDRGIRSFIEMQMHGVWTTFIVANLIANLALAQWGLDPAFTDAAFLVVMTLTTAIGFASMGVLFTPRFYGVAAVFAALLFVHPAVGVGLGWVLLGAVWFVSLFASGWLMHRAGLRRQSTSTLL